MTIDDVVALAKAKRPESKFAKASNGYVLGEWNEAVGRYVPVVGYCLDGVWRDYPTYEILVNGELIQREWIEV